MSDPSLLNADGVTDRFRVCQRTVMPSALIFKAIWAALSSVQRIRFAACASSRAKPPAHPMPWAYGTHRTQYLLRVGPDLREVSLIVETSRPVRDDAHLPRGLMEDESNTTVVTRGHWSRGTGVIPVRHVHSPWTQGAKSAIYFRAIQPPPAKLGIYGHVKRLSLT